MADVLFDTQKMAEQLQDPGTPEARIDWRIAALEAEMRAAIADAKAELIKWVGTVLILQMALVVALALLLT